MLSIKHLNTDASFLLTFEPLALDPAISVGYKPKPFHILLDPCINGSSKICHSKISLLKHKEPACVSSLSELPEPDLIIISRSKNDHCNEATLKQISPLGKTIILAEPAAARVIRGWRHFERNKVQALKRWEGPHNGWGTDRDAVTRIPLRPLVPGGEPGEVTVAYIPQRRDLTGVHAAVGITFKSLRKRTSLSSRTEMLVLPYLTTPPRTPESDKSPTNSPAASAGHHSPGSDSKNNNNNSSTTITEPSDDTLLPMIPGSPSLTLRSAQSIMTLTAATEDTLSTDAPTPPLHLTPPINGNIDATITATTTTAAAATTAATATSATATTPPPPPPSPPPVTTSTSTTTASAANTTSKTPIISTHTALQRTLSVLFSPHGIPFTGNLESYATIHLVNEAALPLTALLHCFDSVSNPWWLGGNVLLGAPAGRDIADRLGARCWVSCHDGEKSELRGLAKGWLKTRRWSRDELEQVVMDDIWGDEKGGHQHDDGIDDDDDDDDDDDVHDNENGDNKNHHHHHHHHHHNDNNNNHNHNKHNTLRRVGSTLFRRPPPPTTTTSSTTTGSAGMSGRRSRAKSTAVTSSATTTGRRDFHRSGTSHRMGRGVGCGNHGTQIIDLASGEEVLLTSEGPWDTSRGQSVCY